MVRQTLISESVALVYFTFSLYTRLILFLTDLVTHHLLLSIAQQRGCCFITEPVLLCDSEV